MRGMRGMRDGGAAEEKVESAGKMIGVWCPQREEVAP
jgi:hypothetical protein